MPNCINRHLGNSHRASSRLREIIQSEARALITANGYEGVNMRELAHHANATPKTLYYQFGSKEGLLRTAVEEMFHAL